MNTQLIPVGWYDAQAKTGWRMHSRDDGGAMLEVDFAVDVAPGRVETRTARLYFTERAAAGSFKALEALGWSGKDMGELLDGKSAMLDARVVRVKIDHNEFKGKIYDRIDQIGSSKPRTGTPVLTRENAAPYVARMNQWLASFRAKNRPSNGYDAPPPVDVAPVDDDQIPF